MKIELLKRSLNETREQMKALLVKAQSENRTIDQQELAKFDELKGKAESLKATIQAAADLEETELRAMPSQGDSGATKPAPTSEEIRNWIANGEVPERSMTTTNTAAVVIPAVQKSIQEKMVAASPIRRLAAGFTTDALKFGVPVEVTGADVLPGDETTVRGETAAPTVELAEATLVEYYAQPQVSQRILDGNGGGYDLEGFLNSAVAKAYIRQDNALHANTLNDAVETTTAFEFGKIRVGGTLTGTDVSVILKTLRDASKVLPLAHRSSAQWLISSDMMAKLSDLEDTTKQPLWGSVEGGEGKSLLGYPVNECEELNAGTIYLANFKDAMFVVDNPAGGNLRDPYSKKGYVSLYSWMYSGSQLTDPEAIIKVKSTLAA
ncbi:phage major capsid protein [Aeromonas caviae]|uniref:phage major capsid protein n=1 Tax=Aeromonas caviae TaxID=648 RepID=UPI0024C988B3|nr:phage major capsid protein [Aeromonas caviae]WAF65536.1 phage major capsid protein [Aeromonas caviae]WAF82362.1 phage major capsid protein [Aeromonas caviae]